MNVSPVGRVTRIESGLFAGILPTVRANVALFLIERFVLFDVNVTFFVELVLAIVEIRPLFAIVFTVEGVGVGAGVAAVVTSGVGVVVGVTEGDGEGEGDGVTTCSTGNSDDLSTVITRRGTDPPRYPAPTTSKVPKVTFALYSL